MMPTFTSRCASGTLRASPASTVVPELELDAEVLAAKERHRLLEVVARRRGDAHLVALDPCLDFLQLCLLDRRRDFLRRIAIERQLEGDIAADSIAASGCDVTGI